ncbi:MAG TPA: hypothetical protein VEQ85_05410 [Lacipirellulaceae bacterium]|nr:hypothetical protein [Lacipirellulaceae bacterium]
MKTERRHELQSNTLATELAIWGEKLRPYASAILMGIAALVGLYAVLSIWNSRSAAREEQAWNAYQRALLEGDVERKSLRLAAEQDFAAGSHMSEWAYVNWADRQLRLAADEFFVNREATVNRLKGVDDVYEQYATEGTDAEVRDRARFGLARVREMQNRLADARAEYARVEGPLAKLAAQRLKELETNEQEIAETTAWLATAPLPVQAPPTGPGMPGRRPGLDAPVPPADGGAGDPFGPGMGLQDILRTPPTAEAGDRYGEGAAGAESGAGGGSGQTPGAAAPAGDTPTGETPAADAAATESEAESASPESAPTEGASDDTEGGPAEGPAATEAPATESGTAPTGAPAAESPAADQPPAATGATAAPGESADEPAPAPR